MNERLYRSLVATVNQYAFWIKVRDADAFQEGTALAGPGHAAVPVRCLTVRKIGLADQEFRIRMNRYEVTRYDAERIIELASYGIIQLHLI